MTNRTVGRVLLVAVAILALLLVATLATTQTARPTADYAHPYGADTDEMVTWMDAQMADHMGSGSIAWMEAHMGTTVEEMTRYMDGNFNRGGMAGPGYGMAGQGYGC